MSKQQNNEETPFWKARTKHMGRPALFEDPKVMREAAEEYFKYTALRFWAKQDWIQSGKEVTRKSSPPFTLSGFCLFVGASRHWWNEFKKSKEAKGDKEFLEVVSYIVDTIETQQFEGASIGAFSSAIIARSLGLVDKKETEVKATVFKVGYKKMEDEDGE